MIWSKSVHRMSLGMMAALTLIWVPAASAQQIVQETGTRFPSPNPSEWTNQATIGDVDGDGDLDIVFANGGNFSTPGSPQKVRMYINDGSGFFSDESDDRLGISGLYRGVEMGDVENDGDLDIVLAQDFNNRPNLLINDGTGFFNVEGPLRLPPQPMSSSRGQFGDIDNDGDLDLFFTNGGTSSRFGCGQYRVYINDGTGFFSDETATHFPIGNVCQNMDCIFGDIDNDFDLDIRTGSTGSNNSRLYRNDGTGVFTQASIPSDSTCYSYDFGDIDGDGDLDLLGVNAGPGSTELLLVNDGNGNYSNASSQISPNPSQDDNDSKFFDYDNDGDLDLIIARLGSGGEKTYTNDGNGNFTQVFNIITAISDSSLDIMVADLTGNGAYDVVTAQGESGNFQNRIYINGGPQDTVPPTIVATEELEDTENTAGPYVIRALILDSMTSDRNFFDQGIFLNYTVNDGAPQSVPMRYSGGQVYRGELPGQPGGSSIDYWVTAFDWNSNEGTGSTVSFEVLGGALIGDINMDGVVDAADLALLLGAWGPTMPCPPIAAADLNGDCTVDAADLALLLGNWT